MSWKIDLHGTKPAVKAALAALDPKTVPASLVTFINDRIDADTAAPNPGNFIRLISTGHEGNVSCLQITPQTVLLDPPSGGEH